MQEFIGILNVVNSIFEDARVEIMQKETGHFVNEVRLYHCRVYLNTNYYITKILEVNLFAFAYRLFHEDFSPINGSAVD